MSGTETGSVGPSEDSLLDVAEISAAKHSATALVDLLENALHPRVRDKLGQLETLVRAAERTVGGEPTYPKGLAGRVEVLAIDLSDHMEKEERVIFPAVRRGLGVELTPPIRVMRREHEDLLEALASIRAAALSYSPTATAPSWREFWKTFEHLDQMLAAQIQVEDELLFPQLCGC